MRRPGGIAERVEDADEPVAQSRRGGELLLHAREVRADGGLQPGPSRSSAAAISSSESPSRRSARIR